MTRILVKLLLAIALSVSQAAHAIESFEVKDIRVDGLQRISLGTVLTYLPIKVGDRIDKQATIRDAIRELYRQGFFHDVAISRDGTTLVVDVRERPSISEVEYSGNDDVGKEEIEQALKLIGLVEGRVFNPSALDKLRQELRTQYFERGKYSADVKTTVTPLERNRVAISIEIQEGEGSRIKSINIVGNQVFEEDRLLAQLNHGVHRGYAFWSDAHKYSKQKLAADLEILRSFYLDRGYVDFKVVSTQVSITPDKQYLYLTINISEGEQYKVERIKVARTNVVPHDELTDLLTFKSGDVFSRKEIGASANAIRSRIAAEGYAYANVEPRPSIDPETNKVSLEFRISPGRRFYVRRITITNNAKTRDDIIRRELRQMEGAILSSEKLALSRQRLMRLGFFESVNITESRVPGTQDQIDLNVSVVERSSGSISGGISYSPEGAGFMVNFGLQQDNFLGTGNNTNITINEGETSNIYSFSFTEPYHTKSGVSRTVRLYSREYDAETQDLVSYATNNAGAGLSYGIPLNETNSFSFGLTYEQTSLVTTDTTPQEILDYVTNYGDYYYLGYLTTGWRRDTRNNAVFATDGSKTQLNLKAVVPGSSLEFYKLTLNQNNYIPFGEKSTLAFRTEINYGDVYGSTTVFPYFENFYTGGPESVRGFWPNRLGPRGTAPIAGCPSGETCTDPIGGALETVASLEFLFPMQEDDSNTRLGIFMDIGNVFADASQFDAAELRVSYGIGMVWLTPIGALKLSYAMPLIYDPNVDSLSPLQFTIGLPY
ncbi:MAG: outer membrane protein assembly factor BamA [Gammaproteobacteria bacterium]|nr:outer membrane protein assembly factor BamA [Gammaproteobacteria bacterium]